MRLTRRAISERVWRDCYVNICVYKGYEPTLQYNASDCSESYAAAFL